MNSHALGSMICRGAAQPSVRIDDVDGLLHLGLSRVGRVVALAVIGLAWPPPAGRRRTFPDATGCCRPSRAAPPSWHGECPCRWSVLRRRPARRARNNWRSRRVRAAWPTIPHSPWSGRDTSGTARCRPASRRLAAPRGRPISCRPAESTHAQQGLRRFRRNKIFVVQRHRDLLPALVRSIDSLVFNFDDPTASQRVFAQDWRAAHENGENLRCAETLAQDAHTVVNSARDASVAPAAPAGVHQVRGPTMPSFCSECCV